MSGVTNILCCHREFTCERRYKVGFRARFRGIFRAGFGYGISVVDLPLSWIPDYMGPYSGPFLGMDSGLYLEPYPGLKFGADL